MKFRAASIFSACLVLGIPNAATAQSPCTNDEQKARELFEEGLKRVEQDRIADAHDSFQSALQCYRSAGILVNLARTEQQLGLPASALGHYKEALALLLPSDERWPIAKQGVADVEPHVPKLRILLTPGAPITTLVQLDGRTLTAAEIGADLPLEPGTYRISVRVPGYGPNGYRVTLVDSQKKTLTVAPGQPIASPASPLRTATVAVFGVGAAALAAGGVLGAAALSEKQQINSYCPGIGPRKCTSGEPEYALGKSLADAGTVAFVVAGMALTVGLVLVLIPGKKNDSPPKTSLLIGPGGLSVRGEF